MLRLVHYIIDGYVNHSLSYLDRDLCKKAIEKAASSNDRLAENYSYDKLNLDKMLFYNFVFENNNPLLMSGCQYINNKTARVQSRYYAFNRTDGTNLFEKIDDFYELKTSMEKLKDYPLIIWTRDKSKGFFTKLKKARPDVFQDWKVHPTKKKILYPNNYQYVFYKGDIDLL